MPTIPAPTTTILSPGPAPQSHRALRAVSILADSTARRGGRPSGSGAQGGCVGHEAGLVGVEREDGAPGEAGRPLFGDPDRAIAVFDRERELALLHRAAHAGMFRRRRLAREDQTLRAPAHARKKRAHAAPARARAPEGRPASDRRAPGASNQRALSTALAPSILSTGMLLLAKVSRRGEASGGLAVRLPLQRASRT